MLQMGGSYREEGVKFLLGNMRQATEPSKFLRYILHSSNHVEHFFRVFDATSRIHFLGAQHYAESESCSLVCHVARCILLVDLLPVKTFYDRLKELEWSRSKDAFADALALGIAQHHGKRPVAYKPWGRYVAAGPASEGEEEFDKMNTYHSRRLIVIERLLALLEPPPPHKSLRLHYDLPSIQRLAGVQEREGLPQFCVMQIAMDLILSGCKAQRRCVWAIRRTFFVAGAGCEAGTSYEAITAFANACKLDKSFKKMCGALHLTATVLDMWLFCEHASCAIRKYLTARQDNLVPAADVTSDFLRQRYYDPVKENEYQAILQYLHDLK